MAFADARELFRAAREAARDAERARTRLEELEESANSLGGHGFEPRVRSTSDPDRMGRMVAASEDKRAMLERRMGEDLRLVGAAFLVLYGDTGRDGLAALVPSWWCDVVDMHYLEDRPMAEVAQILHYSERRCWTVAGAALDVADTNGELWTRLGRGSAEG